MTLLYIFGSAFCVVFFLGLQSQFVRNRWKTISFITSFMISLCEIMILKSVPNADFYELVAFVLGGPSGLLMSIVVYEKFYYNKKGKIL